VAKALFDGFVIDFPLAPHVVKMLGGGVAALEDVAAVDGALHHSLAWLLENDVTEDLELFFTTASAEGAEGEDLLEGGSSMRVTNDNKAEFVKRMVDKALGLKGSETLSRAFLEVFPGDVLKVFDPSELALLICGRGAVDVDDWRRHTTYKAGYSERDKVDPPSLVVTFGRWFCGFGRLSRGGRWSGARSCSNL
jgi:hypothetical protein